MRKQTKVAVVVSAAALLAMGASMTSFAKGWTLEDNEWVYLDSDGERIYGDWKKSVDGNYYWLDEETGVMATDRLVEDDKATYYVKADGTRVVNDWVAVDNEDEESVGDNTPDTLWYYFGSNGKAHKASTGDMVKKTVNGHTYFFDAAGHMYSGWLEYTDANGNKNTYYCGTEDQGYAYKGWQYIDTEVAVEADVLSDGVYEDEVWVYLDSGKLTKGKTKYIDGHYYHFNAEGVMETGWIKNAIGTDAVAGVASDAKAYAFDDGAMRSGWYKVADGDDTNWYYFVTVRQGDNAYRSIPFNSGSEDGWRAKSIDSKTFVFDENGVMKTGKQDLKNEHPLAPANTYDSVTSKTLATDGSGIYYFEEDGNNKGALKTGKVTITEDGEEFHYYFGGKDGQALQNTIKDNVIYYDDCVRLEAKDGNTYEIKTITQDIKDTDGKTVIPGATGPEPSYKVVVSSTGKVRTSGTVRIDGEKYEIKFDKTAKKFEVNQVQ